MIGDKLSVIYLDLNFCNKSVSSRLSRGGEIPPFNGETCNLFLFFKLGEFGEFGDEGEFGDSG